MPSLTPNTGTGIKPQLTIIRKDAVLDLIENVIVSLSGCLVDDTSLLEQIRLDLGSRDRALPVEMDLHHR